MDPTTVTFVDYRRPPSVKVLPPSKYKLWLLVFVCVYLAVWAAEAANLAQALRFRGWLSPDGAQFLVLAITVFVMVFGALDVVVALGTIKCGGKEYGLAPSLKGGKRIEWIHQTKYSDSFLMECLKGGIDILEDGFRMFNAASPAPSPIPRPMKRRRSSKAKATTSKKETFGETQHNGIQAGEERNGDYSNDEDYGSDGDDFELPFKCKSDTCKTMVKIEHRINPDKITEYKQWQQRVQRAAQIAPGLISIQSTDIVQEEIVAHSDNHQQDMDVTEEDDVETGQRLVKKSSSGLLRLPTFRHYPTAHSTTTNIHTVYLTFDNIDSLNDWMLSPRRRALMKQLEPLLAVPSVELIQAERAASARDAFTNLAIQQGRGSPKSPPKKWKVWWLTTIALVISSRWSASFLAYYLEFWGLNKAHPRVRALVAIFIVTFLNSYVMTPFLLFLFSPWLIREKNEVDERFIWKTLNDGFQSLWLKVILTFALYGSCIIAWIAQTF